jgi:hypothetical protein
MITLAKSISTNTSGDARLFYDLLGYVTLIQYVITGTVTVKLEGSIDGENWVELDSQTASALERVVLYPHLRVTTTGGTGTFSASVFATVTDSPASL